MKDNLVSEIKQMIKELIFFMKLNKNKAGYLGAISGLITLLSLESKTPIDICRNRYKTKMIKAIKEKNESKKVLA